MTIESIKEKAMSDLLSFKAAEAGRTFVGLEDLENILTEAL